MHRRAGHLRATRWITNTLARVYETQERFEDAALAYCACGDGKAARKAASRCADARGLIDRLPLCWGGEREAGAACEVLALKGRSASPESVASILPRIIELSRLSTEGPGNTATQAAEALAQLSSALGDSELEAAEVRFRELAASDHLVFRGAGVKGLRILTDDARIDATDTLIDDFLADSRYSDIWPGWVAERLDSPGRRERVRQAALKGDAAALLTMRLAEEIDGDEGLEAACTAFAQRVAASDLGYSSDGAIHGLMALDVVGGIAASSPLKPLREEVAGKLALYALETRWPTTNRISAVWGLGLLGKTLVPAEIVGQLRALADPETDLEDEGRGMFHTAWAEVGELEAVALATCFSLCDDTGPPEWLRGAALRARTDPRAMLRAEAWRRGAECEKLKVDEALALALTDAEASVRVAALYCWRRRRGQEKPPAGILARLVEDEDVGVRIEAARLLGDLRVSHADPDAAALLGDADALVARLATKLIVSAQKPEAAASFRSG